MEKKTPKGKNTSNQKKWFKNIGLIVIIAVFAAIFFIGRAQPSKLTENSYNDIINKANSGEITKLNVKGNKIEATTKGNDKPTIKSQKEDGASILWPRWAN